MTKNCSSYVLGSLSIFLCCTCVSFGGGQRHEGKKGLDSSNWTKTLALLNQDPQGSQLIQLYNAPLNEDLTAICRNEDRRLSTLWQKDVSKALDQNVQDGRLRRNQWFHQQISLWNRSLLEPPLSFRSEGFTSYRRLAEKVTDEVRANPVARLDNVQSYPQGNQVGFCFGRALLVHLRLLQEGVPQRAIAKIFTVGDLLVEGELWRFHVAIVVQDPEWGLMVVDPLHVTPLPIAKWLDINRNYAVKRPLSRVRFFLTDPRKFVPSLGQYQQAYLEEPAVKDYFEDLAKTL